MNKLKTYWKEILIAILVLFSLNKCTVACNRSNTIKTQDTEISKKDSIIKLQSDTLNILKVRFEDAQKSQSTYQGIALGNQNELVNMIEDMKTTIGTMTSKIQQLSNENAKLKKENKELKETINR